MNYFYLLISTSLLLAATNIKAADKHQIIDKGLDGEQRQYFITCTDGTTRHITKYYEVPESMIEIDKEELSKKLKSGLGTAVGAKPPKLIKVCIELEDGTENCRSKWDIDSAAKTSCTL